MVSKEAESAVSHLHLSRKSGTIFFLLLTTATVVHAQVGLSPNSPKPAPPSLQKRPPATNAANMAPFIPAVCSLHKKIGPFLTSDDAELAAQSLIYPILRMSPVYSEGFPDSDLNPLQYYFYVDVLTACY